MEEEKKEETPQNPEGQGEQAQNQDPGEGAENAGSEAKPEDTPAEV